MNSDSSIAATKTPSDSELVARAQRGDADAFATLFHTHKPRVYSLCLRMTNNAAEAEDVTQEAFLQVFRKLSTFRGDSALSTWLHRIAVNTVLMRFRKKSLPELSLEETYTKNTDAKPMRRECGTRDRYLAGSIDRIALIQVIRELPEGYRTIFLLHEVEGYEHKEIAAFLGCSTGNSKSQLHKAKLRIRELLADLREDRNETVRERQTNRKGGNETGWPFVEQWESLLGFTPPAALHSAMTGGSGLAEANG